MRPQIGARVAGIRATRCGAEEGEDPEDAAGVGVHGEVRTNDRLQKACRRMKSVATGPRGP